MTEAVQFVFLLGKIVLVFLEPLGPAFVFLVVIVLDEYPRDGIENLGTILGFIGAEDGAQNLRTQQEIGLDGVVQPIDAVIANEV